MGNESCLDPSRVEATLVEPTRTIQPMYTSDHYSLCSTVPSLSPTCTWVHVTLLNPFYNMTALSFLYFFYCFGHHFGNFILIPIVNTIDLN